MGVEVSRPIEQGRLSEPEVAALVARAVELDAHRGSVGDLDVAAVRQVVADVGVSDAAFQQALSEWRAGTLVPQVSTGRPSPVALALAERLVHVPPDRAAARLDAALNRQCFDRIRRVGAQSQYVRRRGLVADLQRGLNLRGRMSLKEVSRLSVSIQPCGEVSTRISLTVDLSSYRRSLHAGWIGGPLVAGSAVALGALIGPDALLLALPAGAALATGGWAGAGMALTSRRDRIGDGLAGVLDGIA